MPRIALYVALWAAGALAIVFGLGSLYRPLYVRLVAHGVPAQGIVRAIHSKPHDIVDYDYGVGGQTFHSTQYPSSPNPAPEQLQVGQPVMLTYNSERPAESLLGDPQPKLQNENISIALAALLMPSFLVFSLARRFRRP